VLQQVLAVQGGHCGRPYRESPVRPESRRVPAPLAPRRPHGLVVLLVLASRAGRAGLASPELPAHQRVRTHLEVLVVLACPACPDALHRPRLSLATLVVRVALAVQAGRYLAALAVLVSLAARVRPSGRARGRCQVGWASSTRLP